MKHPQAEFLYAIADGIDIEYQVLGDWMYCQPNLLCSQINNGSAKHIRYRIKPKTIRIGDVDVPEPEREALPYGTHYYILHLTSIDNYSACEWCDTNFDTRNLKNGLVHMSSENAIAHAKALISLTSRD